MKNIFLLLAAPFIFFTVQSKTVTQTEADYIVWERLIQETQPHIVYAKDGVQSKMTITTANGEILEVNYKFWLYYINYFNNAGQYVFVKESNGKLLEVNVTSDATPEDLAAWRTVISKPPVTIEDYYADAKQLYFDEIIKNDNHPNFNNPELDEKEIDKIFKIIQAVYNSNSLERDTVFDIYRIHGFYCYSFNSIFLNVNAELPSIKNLSQGIIPTGDEMLDNVLAAYSFDSVRVYYTYPRFPWLTVFTKKEYNMIPVAKEFNELESVLLADFDKGCMGDGNTITLIRDEDSATITFSIGRGDCPAGCIYRRYWEFKVSGGVAEFIRTY